MGCMVARCTVKLDTELKKQAVIIHKVSAILFNLIESWVWYVHQYTYDFPQNNYWTPCSDFMNIN